MDPAGVDPGGVTTAIDTTTGDGESSGPASASSTGQTSSGSASSTGSWSSTSGETSSSSGEDPGSHTQLVVDWSLTFETFEPNAVEVMPDGLIVLGGFEGEVASLRALYPDGSLAWTHDLDPFQWGVPVEVEQVVSLAVLDEQDLAVSVARGNDDIHPAYASPDRVEDGLLRFDVTSQMVEWSNLLNVPMSEPDASPLLTPFEVGGVASDGDGILLSGLGNATYPGDEGQSAPYTFPWTQWVDAASGSRLWSRIEGWSRFNGNGGRIVRTTYDVSDSSLLCDVQTRDLATGAPVSPGLPFELGLETCWGGDEFSDGRYALSTGNESHGYIQIAAPGSLTKLSLDATDLARADGLYVAPDDTLYGWGLLADPATEGVWYGFAHIEIADPPSTSVGFDFTYAERPLTVAFASADEFLFLRRVEGTKVLEMRVWT